MPKRDEFDDPAYDGIVRTIFRALNPSTSMASNSNTFKFVTIIVTIAVFAAVLWYNYPKERDLQDASVPVIQANAEPFRVKPDDEGGMDILFGDSTVFDTIASGDESKPRRVENLLGDDERPMPREKMFAGLKTELSTETQQNIKAPKEKASEEKAETVKEKVPVKEQDVSNITAKTNITNVAKPDKKPPAQQTSAPKPKPVKTTATQQSGSYFVQLGSLTSANDAQNAWSQYSKKYKGVLENLNYRIKQAEVKDKGVFHRLQAGPLDQVKAKAVCNQIKDKFNGGCFVIKD